jgi:hypothetical protein
MATRVLIAATLGGLALAACDPLPRPDYVDVKLPASYRVQPDGTRVDNASYNLDNQGYRLDDQGERVGIVDVPEKTAGDNSNAVAGYYISNTGQMAPGRVASTSDIVAPVGSEPTPSQMPQQVPISPTPGNAPPPAGYK